MILFDLHCSKGHGFEAWFRDGKSYERLAEAGEISCAICGDNRVEKALMAPNVRTTKAAAPRLIETRANETKEAPASTSDGERGDHLGEPASPPVLQAKTAMAPAQQQSVLPEKVVEVMKMLRQAQTFIEKNFDPVGRNFAEEARKIHYGEAEKRNIYGEATKDEAEALADEGIEVNQMPWLPSRDS